MFYRKCKIKNFVVLDVRSDSHLEAFLSKQDMVFFNWDSAHARLKSHYEAWSYKKKKNKKIRAHRKSV